MDILHITAHLGGGAGKAVSGLAVCGCADAKHRIMLLEEPIKNNYADYCKDNNVTVVIYDESSFEEEVDSADIVVVSWWDHPRMARIMLRLSEIPCRVLLWTHINGCVYPYLPYDLAAAADALLVTTPYTLENPVWSDKEREYIRADSFIVNGMGNFRPEKITAKTDYRINGTLTVGYVGTLNYAKINKDFFTYCKAAAEKLPNIRFMLVGEPDTVFLNDAKSSGIEEKIVFTGYTDNVYRYLEQMDIFGYLLTDDNYATTENALIEAMASGLPTVVCNNRPEQYIIKHDDNGFLVSGVDEYAMRIEKLAGSEELRRRLGTAAREHIISNYSVETNCAEFRKAAAAVMKKDKTKKNFRSALGDTPWEWFLACTSKDREALEKCLPADSEEKEAMAEHFLENCSKIYLEKTKSSIQHFQGCYPDDENLSYLTGRIREIKNATPGGKRRPLAKQLPLELPYLLQIFPVYGCNFKCAYCLHSLPREQHGYISNKASMDMELYRKIIDDIKASGKKLRMLRFAAIGEPLLHKNIANMVAYAKEADIADSIDIVTNGSLLTKKLSDELISAGLTRLRISLEGLSDEDYKRNAGANINFAEMIENISYFYSNCRQTHVYIKIIDYMVKKPEERIRFYSTFGPICHSLAIEHLTPTIAEIDYDNISGKQKNDRPQNGASLIKAKVCPQPFYMMQINCDGNVVPCCSMRYPAVLGNVYDDTVQDIWLGKEYNKLRNALLGGTDNANEVCGRCSLYLYDLHSEDVLDGDSEELRKIYG